MSRTRLFQNGIIAVGVGLLLLAPQAVSAQAVTAEQTFISGVTLITTFAITVLNFLAWLMLAALDIIMDPKFIFELSGTGEEGALVMMLREVWQFTRDLVNLGFAIGLIVGAVMMIITADGTKMKEHMYKFVIALVLVNFSWFIPRVIFDFSQILTYSIYQIPSLLGADNCILPPTAEDAEPQPCRVVVGYKFFESQTSRIAENGNELDANGQVVSTGWECVLRPLVCVQMVPINDANAQIRTSTKVLDGLIVNHARLQWLAQIQPAAVQAQLGAAETDRQRFAIVLGSTVKQVVVLILHIAIVFPLIAMVAAFAIRIPVLWVSMAFMPLVALAYAFPKLKEGEYKELFFDWQDHFLKAVFLPAKVGIPFAIGFIMLNAGAQLPAPQGLGTFPLLPIFVGVRDLWQFLWMGIAMFIIWHYAFEQLKAEKAGFMGRFTDTILGIGQGLGGIAMRAPLSIPFLPMPVRQADGTFRTTSVSPLQAAHTFDPRRVNADLAALGRFDGSRFNFNNNQQTGQNSGMVQALRTGGGILRTNIETASNIARTNPERQKAFTELVNQIRGDNNLRAAAGQMTEEELMNALIAAQNPALSDEQQRVLRATVVNSERGFGRNRVVQ